MRLDCPRCRTANPEAARFCRQCGLALVRGSDGALLGPGRVQHPQPLTAPAGFQALEGAADLYFRMKAAWGGQVLSSTEPLTITGFNAGYPLVAVKILVRGEGPDGATVFCTRHELERWPRGQTVTLEIPSWELPDEPHKLSLALDSADFELEE
jgi:hypothetical protein